jgi:membrane-associated phospholipid phosphatase
MRRRAAGIALIGLFVTEPSAGFGQTAAPKPAAPAPDRRSPEPPALVGRPLLEWSVTAAGGLLWISTGVFLKPEIAPSECRWCSSNGFDDWVQESLRWSDAQTADVISDVISYGVAPLSAGGLVALAAAQEGRAGEILVDEVIVAEALVASGLVGEAFRFATGRERPSVRALPPEEKPNTAHPEENNLSFISGHVATSFGLAVASGTVATLRRRRLAPLIWATGLTLAAATSYLRLASDEHYATDVLAAAVAGSAVGLAVPLLHRPRGEPTGWTALAAPAPGGAMLLLVWR